MTSSVSSVQATYRPHMPPAPDPEIIKAPEPGPGIYSPEQPMPAVPVRPTPANPFEPTPVSPTPERGSPGHPEPTYPQPDNPDNPER